MSNSVPTRNNHPLLTLAVTPGEPAGIGPDLALMVGSTDLPMRLAWVIDPALLKSRAALLGVPCSIDEFSATTGQHRAGRFSVLPAQLAAPVRPGTLDPSNSPYVLNCLDLAIAGCLEGRFDAMVTGPVSKASINDAGVAFSGHTEYLAAAAGVPQTVMMLATPTLRVALVTTHVPLHAVPKLVTQAQLGFVLNTVDRALKNEFGVLSPRISVCGLNPHAGESGHMGREEIEQISPAIAAASAAGLDVSGPWPGDTAFTAEALQHADVVVAMYHDQGLAPLKALGFGEAVNITLGLPFIRTSVDHGTALDLAGTGRASAGSLIAAIETAAMMAQCRQNLQAQG